MQSVNSCPLANIQVKEHYFCINSGEFIYSFFQEGLPLGFGISPACRKAQEQSTYETLGQSTLHPSESRALYVFWIQFCIYSDMERPDSGTKLRHWWLCNSTRHNTITQTEDNGGDKRGKLFPFVRNPSQTSLRLPIHGTASLFFCITRVKTDYTLQAKETLVLC